MKRSIITAIFCFFMALGTTGFAQGGGVWNFAWDIGFPVGSTNDFLSQTSFRGFAIEGRGYVSNRFLVGGRAAWNVFYENFGWVTEQSENYTIYGYKRRYMNAVPLMITSHIEFGNGVVIPYAGVGVGTYYIETRDFLGIYYAQEKAWHFGVYPEIGIVIPFGSRRSTGININAKYNYAAKTKDSSEHSWISLGVGLSFIF